MVMLYVCYRCGEKIQLKMNYTFVRPKADGWPA